MTEWSWATAETHAPWLLGWLEPPERVVVGREDAVVDVGRDDVVVGKLVVGSVDVEAVVVDETLLS